jgi:hypothetical protein
VAARRDWRPFLDAAAAIVCIAQRFVYLITVRQLRYVMASTSSLCYDLDRKALHAVAGGAAMIRRRWLFLSSFVTLMASAVVVLPTQGAQATVGTRLAETSPSASGAAVGKYVGAIRSEPGITNGNLVNYSVQSAVFSAPSKADVGGSVSCPSGTVVLGGGVYSEGAPINTSSPLGGTSTTAWQAYVNNIFNGAVSVTVYAVCGAAPNGYALVSSAPIDNPAGNQTTHVVVSCPSGTKVLGGGGALESSDINVNLSSSLPVKVKVDQVTHYEWRIDANNAGTGDNHAVSYAICGKKVSGYTLLKGGPASFPGGSISGPFVACPVVTGQQTLPMGGGVHSSSSSTIVALAGTFPYTTGGYPGWDNGYQSYNVPTTLTPYVVCAL